MGHVAQDHVEDIKVCLRIRPLNTRERNPQFWKSIGERGWKILPHHSAIVQLQTNGRPVTGDDRKMGRTMFVYDKIFDENDTTEYVYDFVGKGIVKSVVEGRNGSIFAYGQTGSGKTHTMQGTGGIREGGMSSGKEQPGMVHLVARDLFQEAKLVKDRDFTFSVSVIEVYNEELRDLLSKERDNRLTIREDVSRGVFVDAVRVEANSLKKMLSCLSVGEKHRVVAKTTLNQRSSRSHIIFSIHVESFPLDRVDRASHRFGHVSTMNLVDLAGSESVRHRSAHSTERRRKEGGSINKSLLTLSLVIQALGASSRRTVSPINHVNYRDSKLTRVLQPSLSGNARLAFICCATLSAMYIEETKSTLQFASRIKHVKTKSRVNLMEEDDEKSAASHLRDELMEMKQEMAEMNQKLMRLDAENQKLRTSLEEITKERDEALGKIINLEKEKTAAVIAAADAVAVAANTARQGKSDRPPIVTKATPRRDAEKTKEQKQFGQIGYLTSMVDRLVNNRADERKEYQRRQEVPETDDKLEPVGRGIRGNVRVESSRSNISEITSATRYGSYRSYDDGQDATPLPILGLESTSPKALYYQSGEDISVTDYNETSGEMPSGVETIGSGSEHDEEYFDGNLALDVDAAILEYSA